jgi:hypothetical protein
MATWKRLTTTQDKPVDVNLDLVCTITEFEKHTNLIFGAPDREGQYVLTVKERPDDIHGKGTIGELG